MHDQEARNLVQKIMHADRVIHVQQLQIDWEPPKEKFFQFLTESNAAGGQSESNTQGNSLMNQNTSVMDSQGGGQAQSKHELGDEQSEMTRKEDNSKERYIRIKNVFRLLIEHAPYLVDDKSYEMCENKSAKEQFAVKIDAIRKSLDIDSMDDVQLLVEELYKFQEEYEKEQEEKQKAMEEKL